MATREMKKRFRDAHHSHQKEAMHVRRNGLRRHDVGWRAGRSIDCGRAGPECRCPRKVSPIKVTLIADRASKRSRSRDVIGLVDGAFSPMLGRMHWRVRQIVALVLGLAFALATSTSVVSATGMAMKMGAVCATSTTAADKCDGCGSSDSSSGCGMAAMDCAATMCTPLMATVPQVMPTIGLDLQPSLIASRPALVGWPSSPDPHPPRARDFC